MWSLILLFHYYWALKNVLYVVIFLSSLFPYSLAMFYVIALAGAHKRVINQLREQLVMVGLLHMLTPCIERVLLREFNICVGSLSTRRAATSVSSSRSCARLRRSPLSDLRCLTLGAAAAPAITPAFQTISMKVCSWLTRRLILPHTCETQLHIQGLGRFAEGENCVNFYLPRIFCFVFFFSSFFYLMGKTWGSVDLLLLFHMRDSCVC